MQATGALGEIRLYIYVRSGYSLSSGSGDDTGLRQKDAVLWDRLTMGKYRNMEALEILRGKNEQGFSCQSYVVCVFVCVCIHALCVGGGVVVNEVMAEA